MNETHTNYNSNDDRNNEHDTSNHDDNDDNDGNNHAIDNSSTTNILGYQNNHDGQQMKIMIMSLA